MKLKRFFLYLPLLLLFAFILIGCTSKADIDISNNLVKEAVELYEEKEYTKSIGKFSEALDTYPQNSSAYIGLMRILLEKGYLEEADSLASEAAIRIDREKSGEVFSMLGFKYYEVGNLESAKKAFEEADKSFPGVRTGLVKTYLQMGELNNALKNIGSKTNDIEHTLLSAYLTLDDWKKGSKIVNSIDLNKVEDEALENRVKDLIEAYAIPDEEVLYKNTALAREYINGGYPFLAIQLLEKQVEEIEEYWDGQYYLGRAYFEYGDYDKAIEKLNNAIMLDVNDSNLYVVLGRAHLAKKSVERGIDAYKTAISMLDLENGEDIVVEYVDVLVQNNMMNAARTLLTDLDSGNDYIWIDFLLCELYYQQKDLSRMNEVLGKLSENANLTKQEEKRFVRYELLLALEDIQDEKKVEELIEQYESFDKYNAEVFLLKGKYLEYSGQTDEAKIALERAIELDLEGTVADSASKILATIK